MKNLVKLVWIIVMVAAIVLAGCESKEQKAEKARIAAEEKALADLNSAFADLNEAAIAEFARTLAPEVIATILKDGSARVTGTKIL
jgi:outer membrane murein-binding lipoprotein Lpp